MDVKITPSKVPLKPAQSGLYGVSRSAKNSVFTAEHGKFSKA